MRILPLLVFITICARLNCQVIYSRSETFKSEKYISFHPFALAEGNMAIGIGFGNTFSPRSEYFSKLSYLTKSSLYSDYVHSAQGFRFIGQYRFHFHHSRNNAIKPPRGSNNTQVFMGLEFRLKQFHFSDPGSFVRHSTNDIFPVTNRTQTQLALEA